MSLVLTFLDEWALDYSKSNLDANEHRVSTFGAFDTFRRDTPNLIPGYTEFVAARGLQDRVVKIPAIVRSAFTAGSARSCTAETEENTSAQVTPTWTTITAGFQMIPSQYEANYISYQADFNNKMRATERLLATTLDTAAYTHLQANRSAVNNADGNPYTCVSNAMVVPEEDAQLYFNELGAIMEQNDLPGQQNVIASPRTQALVREYSSQGTSNAENRAFQFGDYSFAYSNRITVATSDRDTIFSMPVGSLAYLSWIDPDARLGHKSGDGKEWMTVMMPLLGHEVGLLVQSTCADKSSVASGLDATLVQSWSFSFDYSFNSAYNSDSTTYPGSIFKACVSKT